MTEPRLAWYRQRAEEEGTAAHYWLVCFQRRNAQPRGIDFYLGSADEAAASIELHAREAAHYGHLVLNAEWSEQFRTALFDYHGIANAEEQER